jgi:hypothetical protein
MPASIPASEHVGDAALRAASVRAHEAQRVDRVLNDRFAARLVADRDEEPLPPEANGAASFVLAVNTATIDEMLRHAISDRHLHTVADFGAGLDTRPYRLALPRDLRWIDVDLAPVLDYKALRLAHAMPYCQVRHVRVDLSDAGQRDLALTEIARDVTRGLVLTEDFVGTQSPDVLDDLIERMPRVFQCWLLDTVVRPPTSVPGEPIRILNSFERHHWVPKAFRPLKAQAFRLAPTRAARLTRANLPAEHEGVWLFQRDR